MESLVEDIELALRNKEDGIAEYLNSLGRLWVTPFGCFSTLKQVENVTGKERKTLLRRFNNKRIQFYNWYVIDGNSELYPAEDCIYCDEVDDALFYENCWLCHIEHKHRYPIEDESIITYLYQGNTYKVTYKAFIEGYRPHLEIGEIE